MKLINSFIFSLLLCFVLAVPVCAEDDADTVGPLPQSVSQIKADLTANDLEILNVKKIKKGLFRLTLKRGKRIFRAKWKPIGLGGNESEARKGNNSPRCETAAYWFNEAIWGNENTDRHLIPLVVVRAFHINLATCNLSCNQIPQLNKIYQFGSFPEINDHLVIGALSYWIEGCTSLDNFAFGKQPYFFDKQRLEESPAYRRSFSDFNLFAYLIQHGDANYSRNFLITYPDYQRIFMVDNGYTFDGEKFFYENEWYGFRHFKANDLTAKTFSRETAESLESLDLKKLRQRLRITALVNLDTGETILNPPEELTDEPLFKNPHFKRRYKGVYTAYWQDTNWAVWGIEDKGIRKLFKRIKKINRMLGEYYPLF